MASIPLLAPSPELRARLEARGGDTAGRCFQCATCSAVCDLAPDEAPFPRRQMLWAQWGMMGQLAADPSVWLCHQCMDCSTRCPRDAKPGDVLQGVRSLVIEQLAFPGTIGRLVGNARATWPMLLIVPILFWAALLGATGHLQVPAHLESGWHFGDLVPHSFLYGVFFPVAGWVSLAIFVSGLRFWKLIGSSGHRQGSFVGALIPAVIEVATHKRFGSCEAAAPRKVAHLLLLWGFVGAAVTSGLLIVAIYIQHLPMPLDLTHPYKLLGNLSAGLLVVGGAMLVGNRLDPRTSGRGTAFDYFFLGVVVLVIGTGMVVELARLGDTPSLALYTYVVHLGAVMCLFLTFPYSKFAHMVYRLLAMVHQFMVQPAK